MDERIYGLLGRKLGHSWSVPIHAALGNGAYRLLELEPDGLAPFLHRKDIGGLNVTIPYKEQVIPYLDDLDEDARLIGAVNVIKFTKGLTHSHLGQAALHTTGNKSAQVEGRHQ